MPTGRIKSADINRLEREYQTHIVNSQRDLLNLMCQRAYGLFTTYAAGQWQQPGDYATLKRYSLVEAVKAVHFRVHNAERGRWDEIIAFNFPEGCEVELPIAGNGYMRPFREFYSGGGHEHTIPSFEPLIAEAMTQRRDIQGKVAAFRQYCENGPLWSKAVQDYPHLKGVV